MSRSRVKPEHAMSTLKGKFRMGAGADNVLYEKLMDGVMERTANKVPCMKYISFDTE